MKPFFSIITRTILPRAELFARCKASVDSQTFQDFEHVILLDEKGIGVAEAQKMMWSACPHGEYVFVLDDDDYLSAPDVLEKLHAALCMKRPQFAVIKVVHGVLGTMPIAWGDGSRPQMGEITVSNVVIEHVQWFLHRQKFGVHYAGDFDFIDSLFAEHSPQWIDLDVVTVERMRNGGTEIVENKIWGETKVPA